MRLTRMPFVQKVPNALYNPEKKISITTTKMPQVKRKLLETTLLKGVVLSFIKKFRVDIPIYKI